jgi:hypothetical protein
MACSIVSGFCLVGCQVVAGAIRFRSLPALFVILRHHELHKAGQGLEGVLHVAHHLFGDQDLAKRSPPVDNGKKRNREVLFYIGQPENAPTNELLVGKGGRE